MLKQIVKKTIIRVSELLLEVSNFSAMRWWCLPCTRSTCLVRFSSLKQQTAARCGANSGQPVFACTS